MSCRTRSVNQFDSSVCEGTHRVDTLKLLEDHEHDTDHGPGDDVRLEHVKPSVHLKLKVLNEAAACLQMRVSGDDDFPLLNGLGADSDPLCLKTRIRGRKLTETHERIEGILIASNCSQPTGRVG